MLREVWLERPRRYDPLVEYSEAPFSGRYVHVSEAGFRAIKNQQPLDVAGSVHVFVFGGSTTFGSGLPDWETIPSFLQKALRRSNPAKNYSVFNFGVGYYYSTLERIRFEKLLTAGIKPDIAIFIDGLNDFSFYHIPDRSPQSEFLRHRFSANALSLSLQESSSFKLANKLVKKLSGAHARAAASKEELRQAAVRLSTNWEIVDAIGKSLGIVVIRVLQPLSFAGDFPNSPVLVDPAYDRQIEVVRNDVREGYQLFNALRAKNDAGVLSLEDFSIEGNQFVDYVHYNARFSKAIADEIAKRIKLHEEEADLAAWRPNTGTTNSSK
jgi:lysophospholipase L1-like esterase